MADYKKENSGALFENTKRESQNHPNYRGDVTLSASVVNSLAEQVRAGKPAVLRLAGWSKRSEKAGWWLSLAASLPMTPQSRSPGDRDKEREKKSLLNDDPPPF